MIRLIDAPKVEARFDHKTSKLYADIKKGLITQPIRLSRKCSRWPEHEIDAIVKARVSGADDAEVKSLVARLHDARQAAS